MSARPATRPVVTRAARRPAALRRRRRRRRALSLLGFAALMALLAAVVVPRLPDAVRELALPLRHEDIIRQQSTAKGIDPSLVAAVIYAESKFRDQTSHAGARGLMQITPATAQLHRQALGRDGLRAGRPRDAAGQHLLRRLLPALPHAPLRRQHRARTRRVQRGRGQRRSLGRRGGDGRARVRRRRRSRSPRRASTSAACSTRARTTGASTAASSGWRR